MLILGNRPIKVIIGAIFRRYHYVALVNMFQVYKNVPDALGRFLFGTGAYPATIGIRTPVGDVEAHLYSHHDMFTVNEIFCRKDYPSDQTDAVVVDIGSNIGISALYFLTRNDHARCYLFEPDPRNVDRLHRQLENFKGRYELTECAVSNHDGQVAFGRESSGRYGGIGIAWEESITVECRHINRVLAEVVEKERAIDLLKIDTEGIEIATVKAIDPDLQKSVRRIFIEAQPEEDLLPERFLQQQPGPVCQLINLKALS